MIWSWTKSMFDPNAFARAPHTNNCCSDDPFNAPAQELDLGSDDDEPELPIKGKKSKQHTRPAKIIPTGSDASSDDSDEEDEDEDGPITMKNMEARSRALDARAEEEADLDAEELRRAALDEERERAVFKERA